MLRLTSLFFASASLGYADHVHAKIKLFRKVLAQTDNMPPETKPEHSQAYCSLRVGGTVGDEFSQFTLRECIEQTSRQGKCD